MAGVRLSIDLPIVQPLASQLRKPLVFTELDVDFSKPFKISLLALLPYSSTMNPNLIHPRSNDKQTVYLKNVINDPSIIVGDYSMYNDFVHDPVDFQTNNVLYHYPINPEKLIIGKYCSIACGAKFMFTSGNHTSQSLSTYPFPIFMAEWDRPFSEITTAWDNKGDIVVGNDVWIGYEAIVMQGVHIGDGAIVGARAVVTKDVEPYTIVGGVPAKPIRKRFPIEVVEKLLSLRWWDWPDELVKSCIDSIRTGSVEQLTEAKDRFGDLV